MVEKADWSGARITGQGLLRLGKTFMLQMNAKNLNNKDAYENEKLAAFWFRLEI